jgi:hypothetical protein
LKWKFFKNILNKFYKYEFKTDAGAINFYFGLLIIIVYGSGELFSYIKKIIWKCLFPNNIVYESTLLKFLLVFLIFALLSVCSVIIGEK